MRHGRLAVDFPTILPSVRRERAHELPVIAFCEWTLLLVPTYGFSAPPPRPHIPFPSSLPCSSFPTDGRSSSRFGHLRGPRIRQSFYNARLSRTDRPTVLICRGTKVIFAIKPCSGSTTKSIFCKTVANAVKF
jgi:hypothetical protein